jgi:hypothetical protein
VASSDSTRSRRGGVALLVVVLAVAGLAIGGRALWRAAQTVVQSDGCAFGSYNVDLDRSQNAAIMVSVVIKRGLPERAAVLVLGAALQESKLDNIPSGEGDRDSVGVLQQRPSQGWGTAAELSDVHYATGKFLDALLKVPNWQTDPLADVIQQVQISADGSAYARHEAQAQAMSDALMGTTAAGVSCDFGQPSTAAAASAVATQLAGDLPVNPPTTSGSNITVTGAGWATAAWLVTHGDSLGIDEVRYAGQRWQRSKGWTQDAAAPGTAVLASLAEPSS